MTEEGIHLDKLLQDGQVLVNETITPVVKHMVIHVPDIARQVTPGQFVMVRPPEGKNFLRRPFSVSDTDSAAGDIILIYRIIGRGTAEMADMKPGDIMSVEGPLGHGFSIPEGRALLVGGGVGIAPLIFLARSCPVKPFVLIGGKNESEVFWTRFLEPYAEKVFVTTDDGSVGKKGFTIDLMPEVRATEKVTAVSTCGPGIMMRGVAQLAREHDIPCEVSMESRMGCGIGVCLGCTFEGQVSHHRRKVCADGPVFPAEEVFG